MLNLIVLTLKTMVFFFFPHSHFPNPLKDTEKMFFKIVSVHRAALFAVGDAFFFG